MIDKDVISSDLALAEGLTNYLRISLAQLNKLGHPPEKTMSAQDYTGLVALLHVIDCRVSGKSLKKSIAKADELIAIDIAMMESAIIDKNPFLRKM